MNPVVALAPEIMLLFVYVMAFGFSLYWSWYATTSVKWINRRGLFTGELLQVMARMSWLLTAILALLLIFLVVLVREGGLSVANSSGLDYLLIYRVAIFWVIGVSFWAFPATTYFSAKAMLFDQADDKRSDWQVRHDERIRGIDNR